MWSKSEILEIESIAKSKNKRIDIGIRLNPNTDAKTIKQISTGKKENKFGVNEKTFIEVSKYIKNSKFLNLKCLSVHIGSQILDYKPYQKMLNVLDKLIKKLTLILSTLILVVVWELIITRIIKNLTIKNIVKLLKNF